MWKRPLLEGEDLLSDENELEVAERKRWQEWAKHAAEHERQRRIQVWKTAHDSGICVLMMSTADPSTRSEKKIVSLVRCEV